MLVDAHALLSVATENAVGQFLQSKTDDQVAEELYAESHEVRLAMREFLRGTRTAEKPMVRGEAAHQPGRRATQKLPVAELSKPSLSRLTTVVNKIATRCRVDRIDLSLVIFQHRALRSLDEKEQERFLKAGAGRRAGTVPARRGQPVDHGRGAHCRAAAGDRPQRGGQLRHRRGGRRGPRATRCA